MTATRLAIVYVLTVSGYVVTGWIGMWLAGAQASIFWPPAGIGIAVIAAKGLALAPAVWAGAFVVNYLAYGGFFTSGSIATGNTIESVIAGMAIAAFGLAAPATTVRRTLSNMAGFVVCIQIGAVVAATIGTTVVTMSGTLPPSMSPFTFWILWWLGDLLGGLIVGGLLLQYLQGDKA